MNNVQNGVDDKFIASAGYVLHCISFHPPANVTPMLSTGGYIHVLHAFV